MSKISMLMFFIVILFSSYASANMVCGYVNDSAGFSPSWMDVNIFYSENPLDTATCKINTQNKYCCDLEEIESVKFLPGKKVYAEIFDKESSVIGVPVSLTTTAEGFDIFPTIYLQEAINTDLKSGIYFNKTLSFNVSLAPEVKDLRLVLNNRTFNVTFPTFSLDLEYGKNELAFLADYQGKNITKNLILYRLDFLEIKKTYNCPKCKEDYLPSNTLITAKIFINSSNPFESELSEYLPVDFDTNESYSVYSDTHNLLKFNINGSTTNLNYTFTTPSVFFPRAYKIVSEIAGYQKNDSVTVFRFFKFLKITKKVDVKERFILLQHQIDESHPLVLHDEEGPVSVIAIYPQVFKKNAQAKLRVKETKDEVTYNIQSNIPPKSINTILVRLNKLSAQNFSLFYKGKRIEFQEDENGNLDAYIDDLNFVLKKK